jgi:hypothetical protein
MFCNAYFNRLWSWDKDHVTRLQIEIKFAKLIGRDEKGQRTPSRPDRRHDDLFVGAHGFGFGEWRGYNATEKPRNRAEQLPALHQLSL